MMSPMIKFQLINKKLMIMINLLT